MAGQQPQNPAHAVSDVPGTRGPTTGFWTSDSERLQRYTVNPNRTPASWQRQGFVP